MLLLLLTALLFLQHLKHVDCGPIQEAKKALKEDWFLRVLHYMEMNPETIDQLMISDNALAEGDIVVSGERNAVESIWPTRELAYVISEDLVNRTEDILAAMKMLSEQTCVSFHQRTSETNYLLFMPSKGCASYVGFIGGEQPVFLGPPCIVGNIVHELLHALGFHHEHTRKDRGEYITILTQNIMTGMERNFRERQGETFGLPYDITSIMHYGSGFFSANGRPTIVPNTESKGMGQRDRLTETDIQRVQHLYGCDITENLLGEEREDKEREDDIHRFWSTYWNFFRDRKSANKPKKRLKTTTSRPSVTLQRQTAASRGRETTS